jgi:hypothetical protein
MSKIYIHIYLSEATAEDLINELNEGNVTAGTTEKELLEYIKSETDGFEGTTFVLDIVDKGEIKTNPKFVSNKKSKETNPA